jgi:hypothetical protein
MSKRYVIFLIVFIRHKNKPVTGSLGKNMKVKRMNTPMAYSKINSLLLTHIFKKKA